MTLSLVRSGASGWRLWLSCISAPAPFAHQWLPLMPLPMNSAAKRFGKAADGSKSGAAGVRAPHTRIDSSQGSAIATPAPRNRVRRDIGRTGPDE